MAGLLRKILKKVPMRDRDSDSKDIGVPMRDRDSDSKDIGNKSDKEKKASKRPSLSRAKKEKNASISQRDRLREEKPTAPSKKSAASAYRFIQSAHITEKAGILAEKNKYVFRVYPAANKPEIKKSVEALYGVKVEKVHIVHSAPKKMRLGRREGFKHGLKKGFKKAIVTLKEGDKIELSPR